MKKLGGVSPNTSIIGKSFVVNGQSFVSTDGLNSSPIKNKRNEQISSESGATGNMQIKEDSEEYEGEKKVQKTATDVAV